MRWGGAGWQGGQIPTRHILICVLSGVINVVISDATGQLWKEGKLVGKGDGLFYSTGSQGGGQETTALTTITELANHAMIYILIGYTSGAGMVNLDVVKGGSPYGAGTIAGAGSLANKGPNDLELETAFHQGKHTAEIAKKLKGIA